MPWWWPLVGIAPLSLALWWPRWKAYKFVELRHVLVRVQQLLTDAVAAGGEYSRHYLTDDARATEVELTELVPQLRHKGVRKLAQSALDGYKRSWASAPPSPLMFGTVDSFGSTETVEDRESRGRQVEDARLALDSIEVAKARMTRWERWCVPSLKG